MKMEMHATASQNTPLQGAKAERQSEDAVIRVSGLAKRFRSAGGDVRALNGVDVEVVRGQMLVLLGPSGCGKTTLLRCIGGLETPNEGRVWLGGRLVTSPADGLNLPPEHRNLGMMFQSYGLWPHMTVFQNVAYPLKNKRVGREEIGRRVDAMLQTMGVGALGDRYPGQLSGGQQQRVALARALVATPTALLFDEPLSNVDAQVRKRLREEIRQMKDERGFAGVYVTHDQEEAMALADVLAVMQDGEVRQIGKPWEIYRQPKTLYVAHFIGEANTLAAKVTKVQGGLIVVETKIGPLAIEGGDATVGAQGHVVVRPEDLVVSAPRTGDAQPNHYAARVVTTMLLGPNVELKLAVGDTHLRAWTSSVIPEQHRSGHEVSIHLPPRSATWIAE